MILLSVMSRVILMIKIIIIIINVNVKNEFQFCW